MAEKRDVIPSHTPCPCDGRIHVLATAWPLHQRGRYELYVINVHHQLALRKGVTLEDLGGPG